MNHVMNQMIFAHKSFARLKADINGRAWDFGNQLGDATAEMKKQMSLVKNGSHLINLSINLR
jgi:hypothetical protein